MLNQSALQFIENSRDNMLAFAQKLIRLPSVTGEEGLVAKAIEEEMKKLGYDEIIVDKTGNVLGIIKGSGGGEHIFYNCHMDQVSPGNLDSWEFPPFEGVIEGGYLHGRGASDTKGAIAPQVYAGACIKKAGIPHRGDIIVTAVVEEEPGDMWGMKRMAEEVISNYPGKIGLLVLGEATGLNVYLGHRGRVEINIRAFGKIAHSSAPWRGVNAVYKMQPVVRALEKLGDILPEHEFLPKSSVAVTNITCSPGWLSTVPDVCTVCIDRRFLPHESRDSLVQELSKILTDAGLTLGSDAEIQFKQYDHTSYTGVKESIDLYKSAFLTPRDEPHVVATIGALNAVGQKPGYGRWDFGTDGSVIAIEYGIPVIGYSPCEEHYTHTSQDRVSIDLMNKSMAGYAAISAQLTQ